MADPPLYENIEVKKKERPILKTPAVSILFSLIPVQMLLVSKWEAKPFNQKAVPYH